MMTDEVRKLAMELHELYIEIAKENNDTKTRSFKKFEDLPEHLRNYDYGLAEFCLKREKLARQEGAKDKELQMLMNFQCPAQCEAEWKRKFKEQTAREIYTYLFKTRNHANYFKLMDHFEKKFGIKDVRK